MPRPHRHLVVFAKAPALGRVKSRLAAEIGDVAALKAYRSLLSGVLRRVARDRRWRTTVALTPDRALHRPRLLPVRLLAMPQGAGDLGARMRRPLRVLPPGPVVIVGSDIPDLGARHVAAAFAALGRAEAVIGPARDGGYWLVGVRRRPNRPRLFAAVRWSTPHALADTLAGMPRAWRCVQLESLEDIDDAASWRRARR